MADADDRDLREPTGARRLSSLSGVVPLGVFLLLHVWITSSIAGSRETYDRQVGFLHRAPLVGFLELVVVLLPLVFHSGYGLYRSFQPIEPGHGYDSTTMAKLQRISGVIVLVFVVAHVFEFRGQTWSRGLQVASYSTTLAEHLSSTTLGVPLVAFGYLVGLAASFFHLVNGMTSFCTTFGYTTTLASQRHARRFFRITGALFYVISAVLVLQVATGVHLLPAEPRSSSATLCGTAVPTSRPVFAPSASAPSALPSAPR
jgi:succinate dehydrogenase / fumarate reductase cytochrome b subunit